MLGYLNAETGEIVRIDHPLTRYEQNPDWERFTEEPSAETPVLEVGNVADPVGSEVIEPDAGDDGGADLSQLNVDQLKAMAKEQEIAGYSKMNREALLEALSEEASED